MKDKIESIQILRGLAALSVVLFHYRYYLVPDGSSVIIPDMLFGWGAIGVDLFFVISGFIMVYVTGGKNVGIETSVKFIINRLTRVLPTYYIILLFVFLTGGAMSIFHYPEKSEALVSALTFHPYFSSHAPLYVNDKEMFAVRWTLNYELYFYLAFSLSLLVRNRLFALACWFITPVILAYIVFKDITFSTNGYNFNSSMLRFLTNPIIFEFGFGVIIGYLYNKLKGMRERYFFILAAITLMVIVYFVITGNLLAYSLSTCFLLSLLVLFSALSSNIIERITPKIMITLGNISFSWYLLHTTVANLISNSVEKHFPNSMHSVIGFVILLIASILVSLLCHRYIEVKLTNYIRSVLNTYFTKISSCIKKRDNLVD